MTCLVALQTNDGRGVVAADACVTWSRRVPGYEDTLQKLYGLAPNVAVGFCGDLRPAQKLLIAARGHCVSTGTGPTTRATYETVQWLPRVLKHVWKAQALRGRVVLAIAVAQDDNKTRVFEWDSNALDKGLNEIGSGAVRIYGSVKNLAEVHESYRVELERVVRDAPGTLSDENLVAMLTSALANASKNETGRKVGVGGLFQVATGSEGIIYMHDYEAQMVTIDGDQYHVVLSWECQEEQWVQKNLSNGEVLPLRILDECDFSKMPVVMDVFAY